MLPKLAILLQNTGKMTYIQHFELLPFTNLEKF